MKYIVLILFLNCTTAIMHSQHVNVEYTNADAPYYNFDQNGIALGGYDVTEYFINNMAVKGSEKFLTIFDGVTYFFRNANNQSTFQSDPLKYLPEFGGYCAYGLAMDGSSSDYPPGKYPVDPETFKFIDGKLYLFYNFSGYNYLEVWDQNEDEYLESAVKRWGEIHPKH